MNQNKSYFSKYNGNLGENGCVGWMFDKKGCITFDSEAVDFDALFEAAINLDAEDFTTREVFPSEIFDLSRL